MLSTRRDFIPRHRESLRHTSEDFIRKLTVLPAKIEFTVFHECVTHLAIFHKIDAAL